MTTKRATNVTLFIAFALVALIMTIAMPERFLRLINLQNMMRNLPEYALLAFGIMLAMTVGGIDLSGVSVLSLSGVVAGMILSRHQELGMGPWMTIILAMSAAIVVAAMCGVINGAIVSIAGVPAIIATLGTNGLYLGIAMGLTGGSGLGNFPLQYIRIANGNVLGIPIPFIVFVVVAILLGFLMERTSLGFQMRMLGASPVAARFSGMNNRVILIKTFVIIAVLAGISAILLTSKVATMRPNFGQQYMLLAVLLSVLGGTNPDGGFSSVLGVSLAILTLQIIATGSTFLGFTPFFRNFLYGVMLLGVMIIQFYRETGQLAGVMRRFRQPFARKKPAAT
ncbi:MAG: ABC transporter permease [Spirochaetaceae bacterium]|nr:MAG: ABC transporter permease [Spirochaetaceae bacterium]